MDIFKIPQKHRNLPSLENLFKPRWDIYSNENVVRKVNPYVHLRCALPEPTKFKLEAENEKEVTDIFRTTPYVIYQRGTLQIAEQAEMATRKLVAFDDLQYSKTI